MEFILEKNKIFFNIGFCLFQITKEITTTNTRKGVFIFVEMAGIEPACRKHFHKSLHV